MATPLRVLMVEDSVDDQLLVLESLRREGFAPDALRVETADPFEAALRSREWDIVLADYCLPEFDALSAFQIFQRCGMDMPFIIVSGSIGEDIAVEALKLGVNDYILKQNLARLGPAVRHELRNAEERRKRMAAEGQLRILNERLTTVARVTNDAIWEWDVPSNQLWWNEGFQTLFGYALDELEPGIESWTNRIHPGDLKRVMDGLHSVVEGRGTEWRDEYRFRRKDGSHAHVLDRAVVLRDDGGAPLRMLGGMTDITGLKEAERRYLDSEVRLANAQRIARLGSWEHELATGRLDWSEETYRIHGVTPQSFAHTIEALEKLVHPEDLPRLRAAQVAAGRGQPLDLEYRIIRPDGQVRHVHVRGELVHDAANNIVRRYGSVMDITEKVHAEQRLREQAELLDKAQDGIIVRDLENRITYWNKGAERIYGWTAGQALGQPVSELLHKDAKPFADAAKHLLEHGECTQEFTIRTKDRRELIIQSRWTLVRDAAGNAKSVLAIDTDVTERRKLEAQFLRSQRMESIGTLAGGIAHDLNNVLAPILMSVTLLREKYVDEESTVILDTLQQSAQRGADMVRQVLTFARGVEGQRIPVQPRHLIADIEKICRDTFAKNIVIKTEVRKDTRPILGDPTQLHQVVLNLCVNARDAMPLGGMLTLGAENVTLDGTHATTHPGAVAGPHVLIRVTDNGSGIPPELHERIFEPFFTTKEVGRGTGLGLSTVTAIVKSHGGFINFYSEPGRGTAFKIYLPVAPDSATLPEEKPVELPRGNGELILIVDDEASVRNLTGQTLEAFGYRVLKAVDGADAVSQFVQRRGEIALVLTDMAMPVMDGPATVHALLRLDPKLKIIAASGLGADANAAKVLDMGVRHFLTKPSTAETLLTTLKKVLGTDARPQ